MRLPLLAVLAAIAVAPASLRAQAGEFRLSNLSSGRLCDEDGGGAIDVHGEGTFCDPSGDVEIRGEGRCVYAGEERPCTWFGFEFDYENKDPREPITCVWTRSRAADEGDPEEVRKRSATADTFDLAIEDASGHYYHPVYQIYGVTPSRVVVDMEYHCAYREEEVLETSYRLIFSPDFD